MNSSWLLMADFLDLVDRVHLCRVKLFRNSRVLGYGRLNGHVASIVSMFSKEKFWKRKEYLRGTGKWNLYLRDTDDGKWELFTRTFAKKNILYLKPSYKTSWICDIYERNYIIYEVSFSTEI